MPVKFRMSPSEMRTLGTLPVSWMPLKALYSRKLRTYANPAVVGGGPETGGM